MDPFSAANSEDGSTVAIWDSSMTFPSIAGFWPEMAIKCVILTAHQGGKLSKGRFRPKPRNSYVWGLIVGYTSNRESIIA